MKTMLFTAILAVCAYTIYAHNIPIINKESTNPFIIHGRDALVGEFPWQGSLQYIGRRRSAVETFGSHICGCALVSDTWVVTAAHCVGDGKYRLYVVMGLHRRGDTSVGAPVGYYIDDIIVHPGWTGRVDTTDAAMIKLMDTVEMNEYVQPIAMAENIDDFTGQGCTISGWGVTTEGGASLPTTLQAAVLPVLSLPRCRLSFSIVNEGHICVGGRGGAGSCNGDSGGPLVCSGKLAGVTSFGISGCYTSFPSVYTRIGAVRSWIKEVSGV